MLSYEQDVVETLIEDGAPFDVVEAYIDTVALPLEESSALWLLAWAQATNPAAHRHGLPDTSAPGLARRRSASSPDAVTPWESIGAVNRRRVPPNGLTNRVQLLLADRPAGLRAPAEPAQGHGAIGLAEDPLERRAPVRDGEPTGTGSPDPPGPPGESRNWERTSSTDTGGFPRPTLEQRIRRRLYGGRHRAGRASNDEGTR
jgi:hypothetical protein